MSTRNRAFLLALVTVFVLGTICFAATVGQLLTDGHPVSAAPLTAASGSWIQGDGTSFTQRAAIGTSKQPMLANGTSGFTAMAAPTTPDAAADAIAGTSGVSKKALVLQASPSQNQAIFSIENSAGTAQFEIWQGSATFSGVNDTNLGAGAGTSLTTGGNNLNVGAAAGSVNQSGSFNTILGSLAGGTTLASGSSNVIVGKAADTNAAGTSSAVIVGTASTAADSSIVIGASKTSATTNDLYIETPDVGIRRAQQERLNVTYGSGSIAGTIVTDAAPRNYMINGGFDVNQRVPDALTTISGIALGTDKYSADRWKVSAANADVQFTRVSTNGALETGLNALRYGSYKKITNAGKIMVYQNLESNNTFALANRTLTAQFKLKSSASATFRVGLIQLQSSGTIDQAITTLVPATWGAASTDPTLQTSYAYVAAVRIPTALTANASIVGNALNCVTTSTSWRSFAVTFTAPSNAKNLVLAVWSDSNMAINDTVGIGEVGLYDGGTNHDWVPPLVGEELARCQRYFFSQGGDNISQTFAVGGNSSTTSSFVFVALPVSMRTIPTVTSSAVGNFIINSAGANQTVTSFNLTAPRSPQLVLVIANYTGPTTNGFSCSLQANGTTAALLQYDADF